jgi:hypothetical protein
MPSDPPLPVTIVRKGLASGVHTPPGRTTVSRDLKGCLEEVGNYAARAGTWLQRHDHMEATRYNKGIRPTGSNIHTGPHPEAKIRRPLKRGQEASNLGRITSHQNS